MPAAEAPGTEANVIDLDERRLLISHRQGDRLAFEQLVHRFGNLVYRLILRFGIPESDREDLYQEIFLKIHHARYEYQQDRPVRPWLVSIALNTLRNVARDKERRKSLKERFLHTQPHIQEEDSVDSSRRQQWLSRQISALPDLQRDALLLMTQTELTGRQVADVLDVPENTVKTLVRRAKLALAKAWQESQSS